MAAIRKGMKIKETGRVFRISRQTRVSAIPCTMGPDTILSKDEVLLKSDAKPYGFPLKSDNLLKKTIIMLYLKIHL